MNTAETHKETSAKRPSKRPLCLSESGQFDEFVTALLTPDNDLPSVVPLRRQKSNFNEWDIGGHVERLNAVSASRSRSNSYSIKLKDRRRSLLFDIEIL